MCRPAHSQQRKAWTHGEAAKTTEGQAAATDAEDPAPALRSVRAHPLLLREEVGDRAWAGVLSTPAHARHNSKQQ